MSTDPKRAHEALIDAIMHAPPTVAELVGVKQEQNSYYPDGSDAVIEVVNLANKIPKNKKQQKLWQAGSISLKQWHENWATRFGLVASKLQAGARFAPSEIKGKAVKNDLDPALHNVLADGWHHQPITQPLEG